MVWKNVVSALVILLSCGSLIAEESSTDPFSQQVNLSIKTRQPNWHPKTIEEYSRFKIKRVVFYQPSNDGKDYPVKEVDYYEDQSMEAEIELTCLEPNDPTAIALGTTVVPHGVAFYYFPDGKIQQVTLYHQGLMEGVCRTYFPNQKVEKEWVMKGGVHHGPMKIYNAHHQLIEERHYDHGVLTGKLSKYYPSGKKLSVMNYENGLPEGRECEWFESGTIKTLRHYSHGLLHGDRSHKAVTSFYEDRTVEEVRDFRMGQPEGAHILYHPNGKESYHVNYVHGKKEGKELFLFDDGTLLGEGEYRAGKHQGKHELRYPNGQQAVFAIYDESGVLLEPIREYYEDGKLKAQYSIAEGTYNGSYQQWYSNGQLSKNYNYVKGKFEGVQNEYYEDGTPKVVSHFTHGKREGYYEERYPNGQLSSKVFFVGDEPHGEYLHWYENGQMASKESYDHGVLNLESLSWFEDGTQKSKASYCQGVAHGEFKLWGAQGALLLSTTFDQGARVGLFQKWYDNGQLAYQGNYIQGMRQGLESCYHENGKKASEIHFVDDCCEGEFKAWYDNGSLEKEAYYVHDTPVKVHTRYYPASDEMERGNVLAVNRFDDNGQFDGEQKTFLPNGQLESLLVYQHGVLNGRKALWNQYGLLIEECRYENGLLEGRHYAVTAEGREVITTYQKNLKEGLHEIYNPPHQFFGRIKTFEANFKNDLLEGEAIEFNNAGTKISSTYYKEGKKEGIACLYNHEGKLIFTVQFLNDREQGAALHYFPNGQVSKEAFFANGIQQGEEKAYFPNGRLAAHKVYNLQGALDGLAQEWNESGVLIFEAEYHEGKRHGRFNKYYDDGRPKVLQYYSHDKIDGVKKVFSEQGEVTETQYKEGNRLS